MSTKGFVVCTLFSLTIYFGCAKRVVLNFDDVHTNEVIKVKMVSGKSQDGLVKAKNKSAMMLQPVQDDPGLIKIERDQIDYITANPPVFDDKHEVISEWEIHDRIDHDNRLLYTIGGAGLSFGASFFLGSLMHRNLSDSDNRDEILWGITGAGTILGTWLFRHAGVNKDREIAIDQIREERYNEAKAAMQLELQKQQEVKDELDKLKLNRKKQDEEIKRLKDRLKEREKKVE